MPSDEAQYKLMRLIEANPGFSQRKLARELNISVGKVHYCLRALIERGFVKMRNFRNSDNRLAYAYVLTPIGIKKKATMTVRFLHRKMAEYEMLKLEIERLKADAESFKSE